MKLKTIRSQATYIKDIVSSSPLGQETEQVARLARRECDKASLVEIGAGNFTDGWHTRNARSTNICS